MIPLIATALGLAALSDRAQPTNNNNKEAVEVYRFPDGVSIWRLITDGHLFSEIKRNMSLHRSDAFPKSLVARREWRFKSNAIEIIDPEKHARGAVFFLRRPDMSVMPPGIIVYNYREDMKFYLFPFQEPQWAPYIEQFAMEVRPWVEIDEELETGASPFPGKWMTTDDLLRDLGERPEALHPDVNVLLNYATR